MAKDLAALQKDIDEVRKWFQDEKDWTHTALAATSKRFDEAKELRKWFIDEKKDVHESLDETLKRLDEIDKRLDKLTQTVVQVAVKTRPK
jgi:hypothetical protein